MISQRGMAGWGERVPGSVATYQQLLRGTSGLKFFPIAPKKKSRWDHCLAVSACSAQGHSSSGGHQIKGCCHSPLAHPLLPTSCVLGPCPAALHHLSPRLPRRVFAQPHISCPAPAVPTCIPGDTPKGMEQNTLLQGMARIWPHQRVSHACVCAARFARFQQRHSSSTVCAPGDFKQRAKFLGFSRSELTLICIKHKPLQTRIKQLKP